VTDEPQPYEAAAAGPGGGELLAVTGRWPLLLRLVNMILANAAGAGADVPAAAAELRARLRAGGPAVVDELTGESGRSLDVSQPQDRERAVRATIEASTRLLGAKDADRLSGSGRVRGGRGDPVRPGRRAVAGHGRGRRAGGRAGGGPSERAGAGIARGRRGFGDDHA